MKAFLNRLWINLVVAILCSLVAMALVFAFETPNSMHESRVEHGDVIIINSEAPTMIKLFAEDSSGITTLVGKDGLVIVTEEREIPGSFGVSAVANPQPYHVYGADATITAPENTFIINTYEDERDLDFNWFVVKLCFWVGFLTAFILHPVLQLSMDRSRRLDEK